MCELQLGATDKARAQFDAYLKAGGNLVYKDRVEANLRDLGGAVGGTVGTVGGAVGGIGGGVAGDVTGTAAGVTGEVRANVGKPEAPKVGHKAAIVLGVIAVAAIGVVGIHSITAGVSTSAEFDPKFDIGLGAAGVAVGLTAFYVAGLGATAGAAGSMHCSTTLPKGTPLVAPIAMPGGGGVAAALSF